MYVCKCIVHFQNVECKFLIIPDKSDFQLLSSVSFGHFQSGILPTGCCYFQWLKLEAVQQTTGPQQTDRHHHSVEHLQCALPFQALSINDNNTLHTMFSNLKYLYIWLINFNSRITRFHCIAVYFYNLQELWLNFSEFF